MRRARVGLRGFAVALGTALGFGSATAALESAGVEQPPSILDVTAIVEDRRAQAGRPARVTVVSPTRVEVEAELPRPGILVLSEAFFPGWVATVDGAPAEILRADYVLRGIALGPGSHRMRFEYRPASVQIGAALTLMGVCGVPGLVAGDRRGRGVEA